MLARSLALRTERRSSTCRRCRRVSVAGPRLDMAARSVPVHPLHGRSRRSPPRHVSPLVERAHGAVHAGLVERAVLLADAGRAGAHRTRRRAVSPRDAHSAAGWLAAPGLQPSSDRLGLVERSGDARARSSSDRQRRRGPRRRRRVCAGPLSHRSARPPAALRVLVAARRALGPARLRRDRAAPVAAGLRRVVAAAGAHEWVSAALLSVVDCRLDRLVHAVEHARRDGPPPSE